ncbi:MAG TPA: imidazole glycerol phosphate synthase subunit HisH [Thermoanaerobaculia bacterium]|nr:imidazole glycerol phosphate synthase subunit HisH [Thermoanaerobaculia bacterium]
MKLAIIDYGMGNLRSVYNALIALGAAPSIAETPEQLEDADKIILPGVGAFGDGMMNLRARGFEPALNRLVIEERRPFLGICLGMQMLVTTGFEHGEHRGLGWIEGKSVRIEPRENLRVPHIGWNGTHRLKETELLHDCPEGTAFYFVHSYHVVPDERGVVTSVAEYGGEIVATVQKDNIYGAQFHPEKSHKYGLQLLRNFMERVESAAEVPAYSRPA